MDAAGSDADLLSLVCHDPGALEALYRRHVRRLTRYAARRCERPEDVADLVAATFVAVLESAHRYDPARGEALSWMMGIARHLAWNTARGVQRERAALARVAGWRSLGHDEIAELEERIDASREHQDVEAAFQSLEPWQRETLWLVGHDGLTQEQAAEALSLSPSAFRMRLMRARRALTDALQQLPNLLAEEAQP
jgi:RNA polymerase sigma factor (sigma-70 family)